MWRELHRERSPKLDSSKKMRSHSFNYQIRNVKSRRRCNIRIQKCAYRDHDPERIVRKECATKEQQQEADRTISEIHSDDLALSTENCSTTRACD